MPETVPIPPMIDFSRIPEEYDGLWVVLRQRDQVILGSGDTLAKAIRESHREKDDPEIVITRVPTEPTVLVVQAEKGNK